MIRMTTQAQTPNILHYRKSIILAPTKLKAALRTPVNRMKAEVRRHIKSRLKRRGGARGGSDFSKGVHFDIRGTSLSSLNIFLRAADFLVAHETGAIITPRGKFLFVPAGPFYPGFARKGGRGDYQSLLRSYGDKVFLQPTARGYGVFYRKTPRSRPVWMGTLVRQVRLPKRLAMVDETRRHYAALSQSLIKSISGGAREAA